MSRRGSTEIVQIELFDEDDKQFKAIANERDISLEAALEEAVKVWLENQQQVDLNDPLIKTLEQIDAEPPIGEPTTPAGMEDDLYGEWRSLDENETSNNEGRTQMEDNGQLSIASPLVQPLRVLRLRPRSPQGTHGRMRGRQRLRPVSQSA
jgi:hypothetical protein